MVNPDANDRLYDLLVRLDAKLDHQDTRIRSLEIWRGRILGLISALLFVSSIVLALR